MKRLVLLAAMLPALTTFTWAQGSRIVDLSGNGVAGVEIGVTCSCLNQAFHVVSLSRATMTDSAGQFFWPGGSEFTGILSCVANVRYSYNLKKEGFVFTRTSFTYNYSYDDRLALIQATDLPAWVNVSAAKFVADQLLANGMIVAGFGTGLADVAVSAALPLPTELAGRRVLIKDTNGVEKAAQLLYVSPTQINYIVPEGLADGPAQIRLVDQNNNLVRIGLGEIRKLAPGIFTANANGQGVPAGVVVRVKPGNVQTYEPIAQFDQVQRKFVPIELDLGPENEFLVLALFGTGWRQASSVSVAIRRFNAAGQRDLDIQCPVEYVGKQPTLEGLDQINARLPRELIGKGDVEVEVSFSPDLIIALEQHVNIVQLKFK